MFLVKITSILIVTLLLFPIAKIFFDMARYQPQAETISIEDLKKIEQEMGIEQGASIGDHFDEAHYDLMEETGDDQIILNVPENVVNSGFITPESPVGEYQYVAVYYSVYISPFDWAKQLLMFGPRKWVGVLGLISTVLIYSLLVFSATFGRYATPVIGDAEVSGLDQESKDKKYTPPSFNSALNATDTLNALPLARIQLGDLNCPSGTIITSDPLASPDMLPFAKSISPGTYPVELYQVMTEKGGKRIALAVLMISDNTPVSWPLALRGKQNLEDLEAEDGYYGFAVDAGMACFMDVESFRAYDQFLDDFLEKNPDGNSWDDYFAERFLKNADPNDANDIGEWYHFEIPKSPDHNVAMFASGWGDGVYPTYWGIDEAGEPTHLVIDFHVVDFSGKE